MYFLILIYTHWSTTDQKNNLRQQTLQNQLQLQQQSAQMQLWQKCQQQHQQHTLEDQLLQPNTSTGLMQVRIYYRYRRKKKVIYNQTVSEVFLRIFS